MDIFTLSPPEALLQMVQPKTRSEDVAASLPIRSSTVLPQPLTAAELTAGPVETPGLYMGRQGTSQGNQTLLYAGLRGDVGVGRLCPGC